MIGEIINNKYKVLRFIGAGGFAEVFEVQELSTGNSLAMKVCKSQDHQDLRRFVREVKLMSNVEHKNVNKVIELDLDYTYPYFIMELAKGSLERYLNKIKGDNKFGLDVFLAVCEGINAIHNANLVHRDIKPGNVLVMNDNRLVVSDLGLGKFEKRESTILTSSNVYMGTEGYIPPEYKLPGGTKNADQRGDIYQLGKMLYNILTGKNPILFEENILPPSLMYIIKRATKDRAAERYQSVNELMDAVNNYISSLDVNAHPIKAFESYITAATDLAKKNKYDSSLISKIIATLKGGEIDIKLFYEMFDKIPYNLITKMASDFSTQFKEILNYYNVNLFLYIENYKRVFEYAEKVGNNMESVYKGSKDLEIKANALRNILKTGCYFNRFYTIGIFDNLLINVKDNEEAKIIANMLYEEMDSFKTRIDDLPYSDLHFEIRKVIDFCKVQKKQSNLDVLDFDSFDSI